jgi:hypothetical protein
MKLSPVAQRAPCSQLTSSISLPAMPHLDRFFLRPASGPLPSPVLQASLAEVGIDTLAFLDLVRPTFDALGWDAYDVRRCHLEILFEPSGGFTAQTPQLQEEARTYFVSGDMSAALAQLLAALPEPRRAEFEALRPWRARAAARFEATPIGAKRISLRQIELGPIRQAVPDYRSEPRLFGPIDPDLLQHELFLRLVAVWIRLAYVIRPELQDEPLDMVFHQMKTTVGPNATSSQVVPEKVHQDGVDGILVPLLVVERTGIAGGASQLYSLPDERGNMKLLWQQVLHPGTFQVFDDRRYFHGVEPIRLQPCALHGCRSGLGVDILIRR